MSVCGVCVLKHVIRCRNNSEGRLFPNVKASDVKILKDIASLHDLGYVTWHGFRRGRTDDVAMGKDVSSNPMASISDIAESLGHNVNRAAFFQYLGRGTANRRQVVNQMCQDTDSE